MNKIKKLDPELISKIAAGEVIERPSSVAKELLENSLDAGSREVKVEIQAGGRKLIRVSDDGEGMTPEDALLALHRHSTSKIERVEDLFAIRTFGFRGEALASIAAVSKVKVTTRRDGELSGTEIQMDGGNFLGSQEIGCPLGTSVEVRDLFFNLPARLKFLKTQGTELSQISEVIARLALANPEIHFQLFHEEKLLANYPVRKDPDSRLGEALGRDVLAKLHPFQYQKDQMEVRGYASEAGFHRSNARNIYLYVNRRAVRDRFLFHAVMEAYRNLIPKDRYPVVILFLQVPPSTVDVNVHPSKWEVKFSDSDPVHRNVIHGIREMLEKTPWLPESRTPFFGIKETRVGYTTPEVAAPPLLIPQAVGFEHKTLGERMEPTPLRSFLGQIGRTYLLFNSSDGFILADQHAAHERILFERLLKEFSQGSIPKQTLLFSEILELPLSETRILEEYFSEFAKLGFEIEPSGEGCFWIKSVPEILITRNPVQIFKEIIGEISAWGRDSNLFHSFDLLLKMMACRGAIQASQIIGTEEADSLLQELQKCTTPSSCPHGRPTLLKITLADLEKMFGRK